jgi:hypothetical protein
VTIHIGKPAHLAPDTGEPFCGDSFRRDWNGGVCFRQADGLVMPMILGVALMGYPYFVSDFWMTFGIGVSLCILLYRFRG